MEIKTCEQYVIARLTDLEAENEMLKIDNEELSTKLSKVQEASDYQIHRSHTWKGFIDKLLDITPNGGGVMVSVKSEALVDSQLLQDFARFIQNESIQPK